MGNFSRSPSEVLAESLAKDYVALHIEQGVPVLDRDLNLLADLLTERFRRIVERHIGDGLAAPSEDPGFRVQPTSPLSNDFVLSAGPGVGRCLVGGMEVTLSASRRYSEQPDVPALTVPSTPRSDAVYLDVTVTEVESDTDAALSNPEDVGMQTSVRRKVVWTVRVAEGAAAPPPPAPGHFHHVLARLDRPAGLAEINLGMITDLRQTGLTLSLLERRVRQLEALLMPVFNAPPGQFAPRNGRPGQPVTLFGRNFNIGSPAVRFGAVDAPVTRFSATEIETSVPPLTPVGEARISVITDAGTAVSTEIFTVEALGPPPAFRTPPGQFAPRNGPANLAGQPVTITGSGFNGPNLRVFFGDTPATVQSSSATSLSVLAPARPAGTVQLTVTTDWGSATSTEDYTFTP